MSKKLISIVGLILTIIGWGITLLQNWISDKQMEDTIREKVTEEIEKQLKKG